jgi:hypothetical protein
MDKEPTVEPPATPEKFEVPKDFTDMQVAMFLKQHIDNPCGITVDGKKVNIKGFYIGEARKMLGGIKNHFARELLEEEIKRYEEENKPLNK